MCWFGNVHLIEPYVKTWAKGHNVVGTVALLCPRVEPSPQVQHSCPLPDGQGRMRVLGCQPSFGHCTKQEKRSLSQYQPHAAVF